MISFLHISENQVNMQTNLKYMPLNAIENKTYNGTFLSFAWENLSVIITKNNYIHFMNWYPRDYLLVILMEH